MLPACRLKLMMNSLSSIDFNFQLPIDFGFNVLFPQNISVQHHIHVHTSWFALTMHESPFTSKKSMQSSLDTCVSMFPPPVLAQERICALKTYFKTLQPKFKLERLRFLVLDALYLDCNWSERLRWQARPKRWGCLELYATVSSGFENEVDW
jgi:hypothetical protein